MAVIAIQPGSMGLMREYRWRDDGHFRLQQQLFIKVHILRLFFQIRLRLYRSTHYPGRPVDAVSGYGHRQSGFKQKIVKMFIAVANFTIMAFIAISVMPESNLAVVTGTAELS